MKSLLRGGEFATRSFSTPAFLLACGALACLTPSASASPYFMDDFEGHTVGQTLIPSTPAPMGRYAKYGSGGDTVITNGPLGGNLGKFAFHPGTAGYADIYQFTDGTNTTVDVAVIPETVTYNLDFYVVGNAATVARSDIYMLAGWAETWRLAPYSDGTLDYSAGGSSVNVGTFPTNEWVHFKLVADYQALTFNATVGATSWSGSLGAAGTTRLFITSDVGGPGAGLYLDNVSIVPEPSALWLCVTGLLGLLACARHRVRR